MSLSHDEIARRFANGATTGKGSRMFIEGKFIYSHGHHFVIAHRVGFGEFIFNTMRRSSSTRNHQDAVHSALKSRGHKIYYADDCKTFDGEKGYLLRVKELHALIYKAKSRLSTYQAQFYELKEKWEALRDRFKLKNEVLDTMFLLDTKAKIEFSGMARRIAEAV